MNLRAIFVILSAGIRKKKLQTGVFAAGCFLCSFFLLGVFILHFAMDDSFHQTYEKLNAPNMSVSIQETDITKESLEIFLSHLSYVHSYNISKTYLANHVKMPNRSMEFAYLVSSEEIEPKEGNIIVNNAVYDAAIGDEIEISINGQKIVKKVESVMVDAINSAPESMIPYFWISAQELENLTEGYEKGSYRVDLKTQLSDMVVQNFISDYEDYFGNPFDGNLVSYDDIKHSYMFRYKIFREFILLLFLFLFTIILIMTVLLSQMAVHSDRKKIGILKSMGFTDYHINLRYVLQYLVIAGIANGGGLLASGMLFQTWLGGMFANINKRLFSIRNLQYYAMMVFLIMCIVVYVVVQCSIYQTVKISPVDAICTNNQKSRKSFGDFYLLVPRCLSLNLGLLKCAQRRFESLFICLLTLGMASMFLISFYILDGVKNADAHLTDWGIVEMDIYVSRKTNADEEKSGLLATLKEDSAVDFYYAGLSDRIAYRFPESNLSRNVTGEIYDKEIPEGLEYQFIVGRNPQSYREAAVGMNFAKEHGIGIGDKIIVIRYGTETELTIVGIYPSFKEYGNSIRFLTEDIQEFFDNQADGYYSIVLHDGENVDEFAARMSETFTDFNFFPMKRNTVHSVHMLLAPMAVGLGLFAIIYCLILLCLNKIMVMDCRRDLEIYRFIGFTKRKVRAVIWWRFHLPIVLGAAISVPLSIFALPQWLRPLARQLGLSVLPIYPNVLLVITALMGIFICSMASTISGKGFWKGN